MSYQEERVAMLLSALGDNVSQSVVESLPDDAAARIQDMMGQFDDEPPTAEEMDDVLDEFMRFFRFAAQHEAAGFR